MRKIILLIFPFILSGCTIADAMLMTKFDSNEYKQITEIRIDSQNYKTQCNDADKSKENANLITYKTQMFEAYSQNLSFNGDSYNASKSLNEIAQGLKNQYDKNGKVSQTFCKLKFEGIEKSAETMQHVLGRRPR